MSLFARHFRRSPEGLGPANIRDYQLYLTNEKKLAPGSILIATSALRFLYSVTMKRPWDVEEVLPMPKKPESTGANTHPGHLMTAKWLLQSALPDRIEMFRGSSLPDSPFRTGSHPLLLPPCACLALTYNRSARLRHLPTLRVALPHYRAKIKTP